MNDKFISFNEGNYTSDDIKKVFLSKDIMQIPILREGFSVDVIFRDDFYILNPDVLSFIPPGEQFNMTDLTKKLRDNNRRIGVYPVSEESRTDVGQWGEYKKAIGKINCYE